MVRIRVRYSSSAVPDMKGEFGVAPEAQLAKRHGDRRRSGDRSNPGRLWIGDVGLRVCAIMSMSLRPAAGLHALAFQTIIDACERSKRSACDRAVGNERTGNQPFAGQLRQRPIGRRDGLVPAIRGRRLFGQPAIRSDRSIRCVLPMGGAGCGRSVMCAGRKVQDHERKFDGNPACRGPCGVAFLQAQPVGDR